MRLVCSLGDVLAWSRSRGFRDRSEKGEPVEGKDKEIRN